MKLLFYISSLTTGGAERVVSLLANYFVEIGYDVIIVTNQLEQEDFYNIDSRIKRLSINDQIDSNASTLARVFKISLILRKIFLKEKPTFIISFITVASIIALVSKIGIKIPIIVAERNNPKYNKLTLLWRCLKEITLPFADAIVVQTKDVEKEYSFFIKRKISVIPNPINIDVVDMNLKPDYIIKTPSFVTVGRFHKLKGIDILIESFAKYNKKNPNWNLTIIGDGKERESLEKLILNLELKDKVFMPGKFKNPLQIIKQADIFVLPSRTEGFPNALCEAMAIGLPSISFNCPTGPSDIIIHNKNGILVEYLNKEKLVQEMENLSSDKQKCIRLSNEAIKIKNKLSINSISNCWIKLFNKIGVKYEKNH